MRATARLFDADSHLFVFDATVLSCELLAGGEYAVILDRTAFFPEGGGQDADRGTLGGVLVRDVQVRADGVICHTLPAPLSPGAVVRGEVDAAVRLARRDRERLRIHELCERDRCHCNSDCDACEQQPELAYDYEHDEEHEHHHEGGSILRSALKHTVQVTVFIFVITLVLDGALELVGEDALGAFLGSNPVLSVLGSALVGLIPNCAASVVIAQLYVEGALGAGAMMAGLLVSAGVGLLVPVSYTHLTLPTTERV